MNRSLINRITMVRRTIELLNRHADTWKDIGPVAKQVKVLVKLLREFDAAARAQMENDTKGLTRVKHAKINELIDRTIIMVKALRPFARIHNDLELLSKVNFAPSRFRKLSTEKLLVRCSLIAEVAKGRNGEGKEFGLNSSDIIAVERLIDTLKPLSSERDSVGNHREIATARLNTVTRQCGAQLKILDDLVDVLIEDEELVDVYWESRQIIDRRGRSANAA